MILYFFNYEDVGTDTNIDVSGPMVDTIDDSSLADDVNTNIDVDSGVKETTRKRKRLIEDEEEVHQSTPLFM